MPQDHAISKTRHACFDMHMHAVYMQSIINARMELETLYYFVNLMTCVGHVKHLASPGSSFNHNIMQHTHLLSLV